MGNSYINRPTNNKKLYEIALYAIDNNEGNVVGVEKPNWFAETSEDRAKTKALKDKLGTDEGHTWHAEVLRTVNF